MFKIIKKNSDIFLIKRGFVIPSLLKVLISVVSAEVVQPVTLLVDIELSADWSHKRNILRRRIQTWS